MSDSSLVFYDYYEYSLPSKAKFHNGKEFVLEDTMEQAIKGFKKPRLLMRTDATHSGVLINKRVYPGVHMRNSVSSWLDHYGKPVLEEHPAMPSMLNPTPKEPKVLGRVTQARYVPLVSDAILQQDFENPQPNGSPGSGYIELSCGINDRDAIEEIMDGRKVTVSIGATPSKVICSICYQDFKISGRCEHEPGEEYTLDSEGVSGKKLAYLVSGRLKYHHLAFTWRPGDAIAKVAEAQLQDSYNEWNYLQESPTTETRPILGFRFIDSDSGAFLDMDVTNLSQTNMHNSDESKPEVITLRDAVLETKDQEDSMPNTPKDSDQEVQVEDNAEASEEKTEETVEETETQDTSAEETEETKSEDEVEAADTEEKVEEEVQDTDELDENYDYSDTDENPNGVEVMGEVELADHESLMDYYAENTDNQELQDAKLTTASRKALPNSAFCGPDRSFPAHDKSHVRAALQRLSQGFPKGASAQTKARIRACVVRKANKLGIEVGDSLQDAEMASFADPNTQATTLRTLAAQVDRLESENRRLKVEVRDMQEQRDQYKTQADERQEENRTLLVDRIVDLEFATAKKNVNDYRAEDALQSHKDELLKREYASLMDTATDLQKELVYTDAAGTHPSLAATPEIPVAGLGDKPEGETTEEKPKSIDPASEYKKQKLSLFTKKTDN